MRKKKSQTIDNPGAPIPSIKRAVTTGNPRESYIGGRMAAVRRGVLDQFRRPRESASDLTLAEIRSIEARVRKELYP
jgi:hypothetical protein